MAESTGGPTPSQTAGPFLSIGLTWSDRDAIGDPASPGAITISGTVRDGAGAPVADALVETWQSDPSGRFTHPDDPRGAAPPPVGFRGFARSFTDPAGRWSVRTLRPGPLPAGDGGREAPHLDVAIFARGLLDRLVTRIYLPDDDSALTVDPVLALVPADRRDTLVAIAESPGSFRFDIVLQGDGETVFFDL